MTHTALSSPPPFLSPQGTVSMSALVSPTCEVVSDRDHAVATIRDVNSRLKRLLEVYDDALVASLGSKGAFSHRPPDPLSILSQYLPTFVKLSAQVQRYSKLLVDLESDRHKQEQAVAKAMAEVTEARIQVLILKPQSTVSTKRRIRQLIPTRLRR